MKHEHRRPKNNMNKQHAELFATLHQLAATVTTVFEVLADAKPEDHRGDAPAAPSPPAASSPDPKPQPADPWSPDDLCLACGRACEVMAARVKHGRICVVCISDSVDDLRIQSERSRLTGIASDIHEQLGILGKLADEAIDSDGARTLPVLEREVIRLCEIFRERRGPFASGPERTDADHGVRSSSRREAEPA